IFVLDAARWVAVHGEKSFSQRLWYLSKTPFGFEFLKMAAVEIKAAVRALTGETRKLLLVDLDETLWGGIVGDLGWQSIRLGGHDPIGEAFRDFQLGLKILKERGVLLGIVSKNEESTALEAIRSHPEMVLRQDDFAGWRINWEDKAQNIVDLVSELNLGLESVVFIDDSPVERARVRQALPDVFVPEWPADVMGRKSALMQLHCFDAPLVTTEDVGRTNMYFAEKKRQAARTEVASLGEWLDSLNIRVAAEPLQEAKGFKIALIPTLRNLPCLRFFESADLLLNGDDKVFTLDLRKAYPKPATTHLVLFDSSQEHARQIDLCRQILGQTEAASTVLC